MKGSQNGGDVVIFVTIFEKFSCSILNQLTVRKNRPPLVTVAMTDKQCSSHTTHMFSRSENTSQSKEETDDTPTEKTEAGYFWYQTRFQDPQLLNWVIFKEIKTINTVLWLFNAVVTDIVLPQFKHVIRSSFHIYLKHEMNMNKHQKVFYFNHGTPFFKCKSTEVNLLFCLIVVKARSDTAAATGHAHLHIFRANNITWKLWKWF